MIYIFSIQFVSFIILLMSRKNNKSIKKRYNNHLKRQ